MDRKTRRIAGAAAGGVMLVGGGVALASAGVFDPRETSQDVIDRAAQDLGISSDELSDALKAAAVEEVEAALEAGDISERQADAMKEAIESDDFPLLGGFAHRAGPGSPWGPEPGGFELIGTAAEYLGLTDEQVRARLMNGTSLAEIAETEGRSVDGLVDALVDVQTDSLQEAVDDGRLTDPQRDELLDGLEDRIRDLVENDIGPPRGGFGHRGPFGPPGGPGR
jgi:hypothetical protein